MTRPSLAPAGGLSKPPASVITPPPPRPTVRAPEPTEPTRTSPAGAQRAATQPATVTNRPPAVKPGRVSDSAERQRILTLSLPVDLVEALRDRARLDRTSQPDVLMDALGASADDLSELLTGTSTRPATTSDGLFVRRTLARPVARAALNVRMLAANIDAIDALVEQVGAPSRSALCAAALRRYLTR